MEELRNGQTLFRRLFIHVEHETVYTVIPEEGVASHDLTGVVQWSNYNACKLLRQGHIKLHT